MELQGRRASSKKEIEWNKYVLFSTTEQQVDIQKRWEGWRAVELRIAQMGCNTMTINDLGWRKRCFYEDCRTITYPITIIHRRIYRIYKQSSIEIRISGIWATESELWSLYFDSRRLRRRSPTHAQMIFSKPISKLLTDMLSGWCPLANQRSPYIPKLKKMAAPCETGAEV